MTKIEKFKEWHEKGHEDPLFGAIAQLATNAMKQGCTIQATLALVSQAFRFADQIIEDFETKEPLAEPVACKAGCHYCCCYEVVLTPVEALLLGNRVKETFSESALADLMKKIDRILFLRDGKDAEERANVLHDTPCIFLKSGKCSFYDARPFVCRALHSLDGSMCKEAVMSKRRVVEFTGYNHRYYVFATAKAALNQFFEQMGCQTAELTIAKAMKHYFERSDCTEAWLRGDEVFSSSCVSSKTRGQKGALLTV